ncbi:MAG: hypothetical protein HQL63_02155 [Magnetococcales bacterium]|nr:hypothetical protein [Magnetococcales bacterium]
MYKGLGMLRPLLWCSAFLVSIGVWSGSVQAAAGFDPAQNSDHQARYERYIFGPTAETIDFGIQPLWMPVGVILETMRRDSLLREDLRRAGRSVRFHPFFKGSDINRFLHAGKLVGGVGGDLPGIHACNSMFKFFEA